MDYSDHDLRFPRIRRFWNSRASFVAAAILIGLTVVAVIFLAVAGGPDPTSKAPAPGPGVAAPPSPKDHDQTVPYMGPIVTWDTFGGVFLPDGGTKYGPTWRDGPAVGGFAHTPRGALIALANIGYRSGLAGDDWNVVVTHGIAAGSGRDQWRMMRATIHGPVSIDDPMQIAGFKFVTYSDDLAVIQLAVQSRADQHLQMTTEQVVWQDGDWKLQLQPDGSDSPTQTPLTTLDGFAPWGASWG